jgi:hypothetical protein
MSSVDVITIRKYAICRLQRIVFYEWKQLIIMKYFNETQMG